MAAYCSGLMKRPIAARCARGRAVRYFVTPGRSQKLVNLQSAVLQQLRCSMDYRLM